MVGPALFLLGAAGGNVYQMVTAANFAPGNAGVIFYTDFLSPDHRNRAVMAAISAEHLKVEILG